MSSDADRLFESLAPHLRKKMGFCPLTPEEAEAAFHDAPVEPISKERLKLIIESAIAREDNDDDNWEEADAVDEAECQLQLHRNEGESSPETDEIEEELKRKMLNDDESKENET